MKSWRKGGTRGLEVVPETCSSVTPVRNMKRLVCYVTESSRTWNPICSRSRLDIHDSTGPKGRESLKRPLLSAGRPGDKEKTWRRSVTYGISGCCGLRRLFW